VNYRDIFPVPPRPGEVQSCAEAGVLGVLPGTIGVLQAVEALKLLTGIGKPLVNRLLCYNALEQDFFKMQLSLHPESAKQLPQTVQDYLQADYDWLCGLKAQVGEEISFSDFQLHPLQAEFTWVDLRLPHEMPRLDEDSCLQIPLQELEQRIAELEGKPVLFICQSGKRSLQAVSIYKQNYPQALAFSLSKGVHSIVQ
jgi:adenylyltransferase/sulfurtransferase